ncbi:MAG: hypothetical protein CMJ18_20055 [Phycisphaeraceae bacterium]|nr:hypothetical protein [Phycisphaeraceae bacterium]
MSKYERCVQQPEQFATWEARDGSRCMTPLVTPEACASKKMVTGLWCLHPGQESDMDVHPDADEVYYVVAGAGRLVLGDEEYRVRKGMSVFIPANVNHQSFNDGDEDLVYYFIFAPPPGGTPKQEAQGWVKIRG